MYEKIKERYLKYYITDEQLDRYIALNCITTEQALTIRNIREPQNFNTSNNIEENN